MTQRMLLKALLGFVPLFALGHSMWPEIISLWAAHSAARTAAPATQVESSPVAPADPQRHTELWLALVRDAENVPQPPTDEPAEMVQLADSVRRNASLRQDARRFSQTMKRALEDGTEINLAAIFPASHPFYKALQDGIPLQLVEQQLRARRLKTPNDVDSQLKALKDYQLRPDARQEFVDVEMTEVRGYQLRYLETLSVVAILEPLYQPDAKPGDMSASRARTEQRLEALRRYVKAYGAKGSHAEWAANEITLMDGTLRLINTLDRVSDAALRVRFQQLADLYQAVGSSNTLRGYVIRAAVKACDTHLPTRLPLDNAVNLTDTDASDSDFVTASRSDVILVWHDKRMERLSDGPQDEFSIDRGDLRRVIVSGLGTRPPLLRPTPRSLAAQAYNQQRDVVKGRWTVSALLNLRDACEPYAAQLGQNWTRIADCDQVAREFPMLFPTADSQ